jgi:hypothetical protein
MCARVIVGGSMSFWSHLARTHAGGQDHDDPQGAGRNEGGAGACLAESRVCLAAERVHAFVLVQHKSIDAVLERGVKLDDLVAKVRLLSRRTALLGTCLTRRRCRPCVTQSDDLSAQSKLFYKEAKVSYLRWRGSSRITLHWRRKRTRAA